MKNISLDTNAYVAYKRGDNKVVEILQYAEIINVSSVVIGELLAGFICGGKENKNRNELEIFLSDGRCSVVNIDADTALYYAHIYKQLRSKGKPIPANDLWIAALCLQHGSILCTYDHHFSYIEGLITLFQ